MQALQIFGFVVQMIVFFIIPCRSYEKTELEKKHCTRPSFKAFALKYHLCGNNVTELPPPLPPPGAPGARQCVCGAPPLANKIVGGMNVIAGRTPWHVGLTRHPSEPFFCGGTIINDQWVLTAAHCFYNYRMKLIPCFKSLYNRLYAGVGYYDQFNPTKWSFMSRVKQQITHPEFNCATMNNDYALVQLSKAFTLGQQSYVLPICLPEDDSREYVYKLATILGWGLTSEKGKLSDTLRKGDVRIWKRYCNISETEKTDNMMCAKGNVKHIGYTTIEVDTCKGDSGGSLSIQEQGIFTQVGITSFGKGCAQLGEPGVYARVSKALQWITEVAGYYCVRQ